MELTLDFIFTILENIGAFLTTPPCSIFLVIILLVFAIKVIQILTRF